MRAENMIRKLDNGAFLLDHGPLALTIAARKQGVMLPDAMLLGAEKALAEFDRLVAWLPAARSWIDQLEATDLSAAPLVLHKMIQAVRRLGDPRFTPMAAVAGSFSELIMEEILNNSEADYVVVNNGGDIAFSVTDPQRDFRIGLINDIEERAVHHELVINAGAEIHGIATSGLGGRSLTRGIASAVSVLAGCSSDADAAATDIANHTYVADDQVFTCLAEEIDYATDIRGVEVVERVGRLADDTKIQALNNGFRRARQLYERGMILGAVIFVQDKYTVVPENGKHFYVKSYQPIE